MTNYTRHLSLVIFDESQSQPINLIKEICFRFRVKIDSAFDYILAPGLRQQPVSHAPDGHPDSGCRRAKAELALRDRQICLTISDDGVGFDLEDGAGQGGNGLASIKKRAQQIGGSVQVQSVRGRGTTVLMTIPLRRRYLFRW